MPHLKKFVPQGPKRLLRLGVPCASNNYQMGGIWWLVESPLL